MKRFVAVQEPTCTWAVFDTIDDVPAEVGEVVLIGLGRAEAIDLATSANSGQTPGGREGRIARNGLRLVVARAA